MQLFSSVIKTLFDEHGTTCLEDKNLTALLFDSAAGDYKKECQLFLNLVQNGFFKELFSMPSKEELPVMLQCIVQLLCKTYFIDSSLALQMSSLKLLHESFSRGDKTYAANYFLEKADNHFFNKDYHAAINDYTQALLIYGEEEASVFNSRGVSYLKIGNYNNALKDFDTALCLDNRFEIAYTNRGSVYYQSGKYERAYIDFNTAISLESHNYLQETAAAFSGRGLIYHARMQYDTAINDQNTAIALSPQSAPFYSNRAISYAKKKEYSNAITDLCKSIELDPDYADAYHKRSVVYKLIGNIKSAIADFETASALEIHCKAV
ncbi:MAG: hypothetical protein Ta2G_09790 [Termitinemataceae bacterium]|nr:MAG: hypothetical protein Ta2G_09790 [Termitinemataceae bacterium]